MLLYERKSNLFLFQASRVRLLGLPDQFPSIGLLLFEQMRLLFGIDAFLRVGGEEEGR